MSLTWQEAVELARAITQGRVKSLVRAAHELADYILMEQDEIDRVSVDAAYSSNTMVDISPFPPAESSTSPQTPTARKTFSMFSDPDLDELDDYNPPEPITGVLGAIETGVRARMVLHHELAACRHCELNPRYCPDHGG